MAKLPSSWRGRINLGLDRLQRSYLAGRSTTPQDSLAAIPSLGLSGGVALYLLAHIAFRLRIGGGFGRGRPVATVLLLALIPAATMIPALLALGLVAAVCVGLIVYEVFRHRQARAWIRSRRGAFTTEEALAVQRSRGRGRRRQPGHDGAEDSIRD